MKEEIKKILQDYMLTDLPLNDATQRVLDLFVVSKRHLLESILEDMDGKHPEYHREVIECYLDDGC